MFTTCRWHCPPTKLASLKFRILSPTWEVCMLEMSAEELRTSERTKSRLESLDRKSNEAGGLCDRVLLSFVMI